MIRKAMWPTFIVVGLFLMYAPMVYFVEQDRMQCDEVIFLEGELSKDIQWVDYISDGNIARIHYCDGTVADVPTSRVIKILHKDDVQ